MIESNDELEEYEEYSEIIIEERNTFLTEASIIAPSEYLNPEYPFESSIDTKLHGKFAENIHSSYFYVSKS